MTKVREIESVDPDMAEEIIKSRMIGERIKRLRLKRSMGLVELGKETGLSASFLSQLETGRVVPTLRNLARIALVFKKDLAHFFAPEPASIRVQRRKDRIRLQMGGAKPSYIAESFGALVPDARLKPCIAEFLPSEEAADFEPQLYAGLEMVYVVSGSVAVKMDERGQAETLHEGDVAYLDGFVPRRFRCAGDVAASALIISMPLTTETMGRVEKSV